jgi:hypothetical protein
MITPRYIISRNYNPKVRVCPKIPPKATKYFVYSPRGIWKHFGNFDRGQLNIRMYTYSDLPASPAIKPVPEDRFINCQR